MCCSIISKRPQHFLLGLSCILLSCSMYNRARHVTPQSVLFPSFIRISVLKHLQNIWVNIVILMELLFILVLQVHLVFSKSNSHPYIHLTFVAIWLILSFWILKKEVDQNWLLRITTWCLELLHLVFSIKAQFFNGFASRSSFVETRGTYSPICVSRSKLISCSYFKPARPTGCIQPYLYN